MKKQYYKDRAEEIKRQTISTNTEILTEEKINSLPQAIQKHFRLSGFVGNPIAMNADIVWKKSFLKLKPKGTWKTLNTLQFNSVNPIMRTALMKVRNMCFVGRDLYKNGQGTMTGKILNLFTVIDAKGLKVSQAALVTSFCEMMLLSGYAFQDYLKWEAIDDYTVNTKLTDHDFTVNGTFHFDKEGKFEYFETDERFFDTGNGVYEKKKFTARVHQYRKTGDFYQPQNVSVSWFLNNGEHEYFKGEIEQINYNVRS